jgi:flagellar hook protein FlgE
MRLETSLNTGRESILTNGSAINSVANNLANTNTTGYKDTRPEFSDIIADGGNSLYGGPLQSGNGVRIDQITTLHSQQGTLDATGRSLDAAISGKGWFVLTDGTTQFFTRAGNFTSNAEGELISANGYKVLGYSANDQETLAPINVNNLVGTATATTAVKLSGNLNTGAAIGVPPNPATYPTLNAAAGFSSTTKVIDSLGQSHDISLYFFKNANQNWTVQAYADGADTGGLEGTPVLVGTSNLGFDQNGNITDPAASVLNITPAWGNGATAGNVNIDFSTFSNRASSSTLSGVTSDGLRGGAVKSVSIDSSGNVVALLDSDEKVTAAQLALANFQAPDGLEKIGENLFLYSELSGDPIIGKPGVEGLGKVAGGSLETSTVDAARQMTTLIQYQQGYRASSQVIQSVSELIKSTIQIA